MNRRRQQQSTDERKKERKKNQILIFFSSLSLKDETVAILYFKFVETVQIHNHNKLVAIAERKLLQNRIDNNHTVSVCCRVNQRKRERERERKKNKFSLKLARCHQHAHDQTNNFWSYWMR